MVKRGYRDLESNLRGVMSTVMIALRAVQARRASMNDLAEELNALAGLARCYWSQGGPEGARKALQEVDKIRTLLATLKDAELDRGAGSWDRQKWEEWLRDVMRRSEQP